VQAARAYLNRQYATIAGVGVVLFIALIFVQNIAVAIGFAIGGILSAPRLHRHERLVRPTRGRRSCSRRRPPALSAAFPARVTACSSWPGADRRLGYYGALTAIFTTAQDGDRCADRLGFGGSLISVFAARSGISPSGRRRADLVASRAGIPRTTRATAVIATTWATTSATAPECADLSRPTPSPRRVMLLAC